MNSAVLIKQALLKWAPFYLGEKPVSQLGLVAKDNVSKIEMCSGHFMRHQNANWKRNAAEPGGYSMADGFPCTLGTLVWLRRFLGRSRNARPETWKAIWSSPQPGDLSI